MVIKLCFLLIILSLIYIILSTALEKKYVLKQVLILSRHNVRTPLAKNLVQMTPRTWPSWKEKSGYLTAKGAMLEGFMGSFFATWLNDKNLLPEKCPNEEVFFVYANVKQRTRESAKAFIDSAFPGCNIIVHHNDSDKTDPIFNPVIHNSSSIFKEIVIEQMTELLKSLHLNSSYDSIENILEYKDSELCKKNKKCDLTMDKNKIINIVPGEKPNISGPLKIGNSVIDAFIMENYQGFPIKIVAWGQLTNSKQWHNIMDISRGYHNVIFNTSLIAKDISEPLVKYMANIFLNPNMKPKIVLLMGHDANIYTVLNGMNFKPYSLKNQYEITPVGGKIVFQRWFDEEIKRDLLKINYVYMSTKQMRNGQRLSFENPPEFALLELENCKIDKDGFCSWSDFEKFLASL